MAIGGTYFTILQSEKKQLQKNASINMDNTISLTIIQGPEWLNELGSWIT